MIYIYEHPETGEQIEVFQSMNAEHIFVDANGVKWLRVYTAPNAVIDGNIDPFSEKQFLEKTAKMKGGKMGDIWDKSREMAQRRKDKLGHDPVQDKHRKKYRKNTGVKHHAEIGAKSVKKRR